MAVNVRRTTEGARWKSSAMQLIKNCLLAKLLSRMEARTAWTLIRQELHRRWASTESWRGFQFDLTRKLPELDGGTSFTFRKLIPADVALLFDPKETGIAAGELRGSLARSLLVNTCFDAAYVAATSENHPACVCWMFNVDDNSRCRTFLGKCAPLIQPDEVLCEGIYTPRALRGRRLMKYLTVKLFQQAVGEGARRAFAFIREDNRSSLAGASAIGWVPFTTVQVHWRWFRPQIRSTALATSPRDEESRSCVHWNPD
jgi:hypothetical protein